jgi:hypothetical protein
MAEEIIEGLDKLTKKRLGSSKWMGDAIETALRQSGLAIQGEAAILAPVNTGALRQSITTVVDERPPFPLWVTVGPTVKYGRYVEYGREAGKMPPVSALEPWVRLKLKAKNPRAVAFLIARKIGAEGVKAQPFMAPGAEKAEPKFKMILSRLASDLAKAWGNKPKP